MAPKKIKPRKCIVCDYMRLHPKATYNRRLLDGEPVGKVAKDFGCSYNTMARHAGTRPERDGTPNTPHYLTPQILRGARTRERHAMLDIAKCQREIYEKAMKAADMAMGKEETPTNANLSVFGSCLNPAVRIVEAMTKVSSDDDKDVPGIEKAIERMKASRDGK